MKISNERFGEEGGPLSLPELVSISTRTKWVVVLRTKPRLVVLNDVEH